MFPAQVRQGFGLKFRVEKSPSSGPGSRARFPNANKGLVQKSGLMIHLHLAQEAKRVAQLAAHVERRPVLRLVNQQRPVLVCREKGSGCRG